MSDAYCETDARGRFMLTFLLGGRYFIGLLTKIQIKGYPYGLPMAKVNHSLLIKATIFHDPSLRKMEETHCSSKKQSIIAPIIGYF